jgi:hypothetical protein
MKYSLPVLKLYLSKFGDQDSREDSYGILSKATAFPLDPQKFFKKAAQEGFPWATWLGLQLLSGFAEGSERRSVFVYYHLLQGVIETYVLVRPLETSGPCYDLVKNLTDNPTGRDAALSNLRPLALWDGPKQTAYRLFPLPSQTKKRRGALLHVDHGNQVAFLSSYVDSIWPGIWKSNLLEYTDYELVPQEKKPLLLW